MPSTEVLAERQDRLRSDHKAMNERLTDVETAVLNISTSMAQIKWAAIAVAVTIIATQFGVVEAIKVLM